MVDRPWQNKPIEFQSGSPAFLDPDRRVEFVVTKSGWSDRWFVKGPSATFETRSLSTANKFAVDMAAEWNTRHPGTAEAVTHAAVKCGEAMHRAHKG